MVQEHSVFMIENIYKHVYVCYNLTSDSSLKTLKYMWTGLLEKIM